MKRSDIQGLRAVAILLVVLYHAGVPLPGGFTGVDVFFVVSGFVITRMLWRELATTGKLDLWSFYARRARRLLPALGLVLLVVAAVSLVVLTPLGLLQDTTRTGIAAALFSANFELFITSGGYFDTATESNPLLHTWTLAVEEQFYLVFPFLLLLGWRRRAVRWVLAGVAVASFAACLYLTYTAGPPLDSLDYNRRLAFFASPTRGWEFLAGAALAIVEPRRLKLPRIAATGAGVAGVVLLGLTAVLLDTSVPFPGAAALAPVGGTVLLIAAGSVTNPVTRALGWGPLVWIGDISYGWYLWHWPAIVFTALIFPEAGVLVLGAAALASLLPAWLSLKYVENPLRENKSIVGWKAVRVASVCGLVPIVAFAGLAVSARYPSPEMRDLQAQGRPHLDVGCMNNLPGARDGCQWGTGDRVLLLGDSNAGHYAEPVRAVANKAGYAFELATKGACPFADLETHVEGRAFDTASCRSFVEEWAAEVEETRPALVVLASFSARYLSPDSGVSFTHPETGEVATTVAERSEAWSRGVGALVDRWAAVGVPTLVVSPLPEFVEFDIRKCPAFRVGDDMAECGAEAEKDDVMVAPARAHYAEERAVDGQPLARVLSLADEVCPSATCTTYRGGEFLYRDAVHLSVPFSMRLEPVFRRAMLTLLKI